MHKHKRNQARFWHPIAGPPEPARSVAYCEIHPDGAKQPTAVPQRIVPVAVYENVPVRRPVITSGNPNPAGTICHPDSRPPVPAVTDINPVAGYVKVIRTGRRRRLGQRWRFGRFRNDLDFLLSDRFPVAGYPLPTGFDANPGSRHPFHTGRNGPPDAAYPQKFLLFLVPEPVAGNPLHVLASGFLIGRNLFNRFWRFLGNNRSRLRLDPGRLCKRFVHRTAQHRLSTFRNLAIVASKTIGQQKDRRIGLSRFVSRTYPGPGQSQQTSHQHQQRGKIMLHSLPSHVPATASV